MIVAPTTSKLYHRVRDEYEKLTPLVSEHTVDQLWQK